MEVVHPEAKSGMSTHDNIAFKELLTFVIILPLH